MKRIKKILSTIFTFIFICNSAFLHADYASLIQRFNKNDGPLHDTALIAAVKNKLLTKNEAIEVSSATYYALSTLKAAQNNLKGVPGLEDTIEKAENYFDIIQRVLGLREQALHPEITLQITKKIDSLLDEVKTTQILNPNLEIKRIRTKSAEITTDNSPILFALEKQEKTPTEKLQSLKKQIEQKLYELANSNPDAIKNYKKTIRLLGLNGNLLKSKARENKKILRIPIRERTTSIKSTVYEIETALTAQNQGDTILSLGYLFTGHLPQTAINLALLSKPTKIEYKKGGGLYVLSYELDVIGKNSIYECKRAKSGKKYIGNLYRQKWIVHNIDKFTNLSEDVKKLFRGKEVMLSICYTIPRSPTMTKQETTIMEHGISFTSKPSDFEPSSHHCQVIDLNNSEAGFETLKSIAPHIEHITLAVKVNGEKELDQLAKLLEEYGIAPRTTESPSPIPWSNYSESDSEWDNSPSSSGRITPASSQYSRSPFYRFSPSTGTRLSTSTLSCKSTGSFGNEKTPVSSSLILEETFKILPSNSTWSTFKKAPRRSSKSGAVTPIEMLKIFMPRKQSTKERSPSAPPMMQSSPPKKPLRTLSTIPKEMVTIPTLPSLKDNDEEITWTMSLKSLFNKKPEKT